MALCKRDFKQTEELSRVLYVLYFRTARLLGCQLSDILKTDLCRFTAVRKITYRAQHCCSSDCCQDYYSRCDPYREALFEQCQEPVAFLIFSFFSDLITAVHGLSLPLL